MERAAQTDVVVAKWMIKILFCMILICFVYHYTTLAKDRKIERTLVATFIVMGLGPSFIACMGLMWSVIPKIRSASSSKRVCQLSLTGAFIPIGTATTVAVVQINSNYPEWTWIWGSAIAALAALLPLIFIVFRWLQDDRG